MSVNWKEKWIKKAQEHKNAGELLYKNGYLRDSISRLYYSAFSLMVAVCGMPPRGRWAHKGILKFFFLWLYQQGNPLTEDDLDLIGEFYEKRRIADYELSSISKEVVKTYIELVNRMFEVIDGKRKNNP